MNELNPPNVPTPSPSDADYPEQTNDKGSDPQQQLDTKSLEQQNDWGRGKALAFRIAFVYFVLYALPFPFGFIPGTTSIALAYEKIWHIVVPWVARHVVQVSSEIALAETGSGNRAYNWVQTFCFLALAMSTQTVSAFNSRTRRSRDIPLNWIHKPRP